MGAAWPLIVACTAMVPINPRIEQVQPDAGYRVSSSPRLNVRRLPRLGTTVVGFNPQFGLSEWFDQYPLWVDCVDSASGAFFTQRLSL